PLPRGLAGRRREDLTPVRAQAGAQRAHDLRLVVDDQDARHDDSVGPPSGSWNTIAVPPAGVPSAQIFPSWAATTARAIDKPRPVAPPGPFTNASKTCSRSSGGMPGP